MRRRDVSSGLRTATRATPSSEGLHRGVRSVPGLSPEGAAQLREQRRISTGLPLISHRPGICARQPEAIAPTPATQLTARTPSGPFLGGSSQARIVRSASCTRKRRRLRGCRCRKSRRWNQARQIRAPEAKGLALTYGGLSGIAVAAERSARKREFAARASVILVSRLRQIGTRRGIRRFQQS
jgi:hypothetical protein